uniref:Desmoplakin n=1 Tax=Lygus hesperus TaxID=30085 RepID=A0A0A9XWN9_LYGHE
MNITVLYDPRGARALFSMKYHYIPLLAILSKLYDYNLEIAAYPAQKFGYRYHHTTIESYVQNCVGLLEPNKTEGLAILNCLTHCEFCMEIGLCQEAQSLYTPACIKHVKGDLRLLLKCELNKRRVISQVYQRWYVHWQKFHAHGTSANPVVLLLDGAQETLEIMDTGLIDRACDHLNSSSDVYDQLCGEFNKTEIQRMIDEVPAGHLIVSVSRIERQSSALNLLCLLLVMVHKKYQ